MGFALRACQGESLAYGIETRNPQSLCCDNPSKSTLVRRKSRIDRRSLNVKTMLSNGVGCQEVNPINKWHGSILQHDNDEKIRPAGEMKERTKASGGTGVPVSGELSMTWGMGTLRPWRPIDPALATP